MQKGMIIVEDARKIVFDHITETPLVDVPLIEAHNRPLARPAIADIDVNHFDDSAMDGFAVLVSDLKNASEDTPVDLKIIGHIGAGDVFDGELSAGSAVRIMTGAATPANAQAVVKVEDTSVVEGDGSTGSVVRFTKPISMWRNIRRAGEEAHAGDVVMAAGEIVDIAAAGLLATTGSPLVTVHERPVVGIISIGSELVDCAEVPGAGMKRNSNVHALSASVLEAGAIPKVYPLVMDDYDELRDAVQLAATECDFVVSSGGASNGDFDFIEPVVTELGELLFTEVFMKPGKAQTFGVVNGTPVFGLPGNPASATVAFDIMIRPALRKMQGYTALDRYTVKAVLMSDVKKKQPRRYYNRGTLTYNKEGVLEVSEFKSQSSALFNELHKANCYIVLDDNAGNYSAGAIVTCVLTGVEEGHMF